MGRDPHLPLAAVLPLLLLLLSSLAAAAAKSADEGAISDLAKSLSNLPSSWTSGGDVCTFDGITCERGGEGRVTAIRLGNKGVSGTLPPSLSSLTALTELDLEGNTLGGAFPSVAGLTGLTRLVLNDNWFASLPKDFLQDLPSLQYLSLENMPKLEPWSVSDAIVGSSSLETFAASNASITGAFPAVLANLTSLRSLRLSYNKLTGGLPAGLAELIALDSLQLNNQQLDGKLSGPINVIAAMTNLKVLWIQSNQFTGPIPDLSKSQLESFNVRDNMLTGVVPASLTGIKTLKNVSLTNNQFQGPMPEFNKGVVVELSTETQSRFCQTKPGPCDPLVTILLEVAAGFGYPYELAKTWNGNAPCSSTWIGIVCSSGKDLIIVNLPKRNLSGTISPAFAKLTGLQKLDLSDNHLTGEIPEDLATMPNLNLFDVTNNNLSGELPTFKPSVKVLAEGNRFGESGFLPSSLAGAHKNVGMIIGILIAVVLLVACVVLLVRHLRRKNSEKFGPVSTKGSPDESEMMKIQVVGINGNNNEDSAVQTELYSQVSSGSTNIAHMFESHGMQFSMEVLLKATNNFNEDCILGKGGFGVVYKGNLDGKLVAVKRCDSGVMGTKGQQEFMAEIDVLRKVRHRHLVGLLGYCTHGYERLLVYEYMSGGTLREHLCDLQKSGYTPLTWTQRMTIALDVARGIEYLHGLAQETFIHRDLKPSNILLDQDLRAKVSDFGLVKLANDTDKSMQTRVAGTFGYLAPEYATTGKVTTKVDVYAYGVILMEMLAGRKALDDSLPEDETHLVTIFRKSMLDKEKFRKFVDATMELSAEAWKSLLEVADLARHCTAREPNQRPDMCHCVNRLSSLLDEWKPTDINDDDDDECETSQMGLNQQLEKWRCDDFTISDSDTFSMSRKYD